jgi:hypothetical protein
MFTIFMQSGYVREKTLSARSGTTYPDATIDRVINACTLWLPWILDAALDVENDDEVVLQVTS